LSADGSLFSGGGVSPVGGGKIPVLEQHEKRGFGGSKNLGWLKDAAWEKEPCGLQGGFPGPKERGCQEGSPHLNTKSRDRNQSKTPPPSPREKDRNERRRDPKGKQQSVDVQRGKDPQEEVAGFSSEGGQSRKGKTLFIRKEGN